MRQKIFVGIVVGIAGPAQGKFIVKSIGYRRPSARGLNISVISKRWPAAAWLATLSAIQNNSDLSQGLKPTIGSTVARKGSTLFRMEGIRSSRRQPHFDWGNTEIAMNMSVTQFTVAPVMVGRNRSLWRQMIDIAIDGPPRTAAGQIAEYLARHQYDLSPALRIELERRHVCV
jgi:hypothetical protein